ncbi:MAG: hypothetical protein QXJ59_05275 [Thermofilaceae archaeon]
MKWVTHIVSSLAVAAFLREPLVAAASVAPDALEKALRLEHRHIAVHNFATGFIITALLAAISPQYVWFGIGFLHHLLLDITKHGVFVGRRRIASRLNSNDPLHNVAVVFLHLLALSLFRTF